MSTLNTFIFVESETWDIEYGPCMEPGMAQTSIGFGTFTLQSIPFFFLFTINNIIL